MECNEPQMLEKLKERLAKLSGGVAVVYVGGNTTLEMKERFDRVEDALLAVKSAVSEGIVSGGGIAYLEAVTSVPTFDESSVHEGGLVLVNSLAEPFNQIICNAGIDPRVIQYDLSDKPLGTGFNVKTNKYVDMKSAGIIDPVKVSRVALESAASIASILLTTECSVIN